MLSVLSHAHPIFVLAHGPPEEGESSKSTTEAVFLRVGGDSEDDPGLDKLLANQLAIEGLDVGLDVEEPLEPSMLDAREGLQNASSRALMNAWSSWSGTCGVRCSTLGTKLQGILLA